ncbi:MAG: hypothetical protein IRZ31_20030 [Thermogemmatispora sp.]|uniref:hypothetical protein n=1 Tax=Thermogemmatispora sp. TaxID=1968838 RepID=UPI00261A0305|nr:hypothetical protein [Thermogemmatispora sp.]MBX5459188.1 hypothetical protein [Thermogemmatispora sp.]
MAERFAWCRQAGLPLYGLPETHQGPPMLGDALRVQQVDQRAGGKVLEEQGRIELFRPHLS